MNDFERTNKIFFSIIVFVILSVAAFVGLLIISGNNKSKTKSLTVNTSQKKTVSSFAGSQVPILSFADVAYAKEVENNTTVYNSEGQKVQAQIAVKQNGGGTQVQVTQTQQFTPGKYTVEINQNGRKIDQDFAWGVLAINPNKSIYTSGETADLAMAVLDEKGKMVCDADVTLNITNPSGQVAQATAKNGQIMVNPECHEKKYTTKPDYYTSYKLSTPGSYQMDLTATTKNGTYSITDFLVVKSSVGFDVERITATRIFPYNQYPVQITITANKDFTGQVSEIVPNSFEITPSDSALKYDSVQKNDINKIIIWNVSLKQGQTISIGYNFKAPIVTPQFYLLGPLSLTTNGNIIFQETRSWQIAADDINYVAERAVVSNGSVGPTFQFNPSTNTKKGDHLIMIVGNTGASMVVSGVTDTQGNAWQVDVTQANGSVASMSIASVYLISALTTSDQITVTLSGAGTFRGILVEEFSGLDTTSWFDKSAGNTGSDSTTMTTGSTAATSQANELAIEAFDGPTGVTSFTKDTNYTNFTTQVYGRIGGAYKILSTSGIQNATGAFGGVAGSSWAGAIATYRMSRPYKNEINNTPGLIGYWSLGESSGVAAKDSSGNGYDGTYTGTYVLNAPGALVADGDGSFNAQGSGYVNIADNSVFELTSNFSLELWFKRNGGIGTQVALLDKQNNDESWSINIQADNKVNFNTLLHSACSSSSPYTDSNWHHLVVTWGANSSQSCKMYIDGVDVTVPGYAFTLSTNNSPVQIGAWVSGYLFPGYLDEVAIYNQVLTPAQIQAHYYVGEESGPSIGATGVRMQGIRLN